MGRSNWTKIQNKSLYIHRNRRRLSRYCCFLKGFHGMADIPTIFQERIDTTLEHKHPTWLDDIIIVTKGSIEEHEMEIRETMKQLEQSGYRLNPKKNANFSRTKLNGLNTKSINKEYEYYKTNLKQSQKSTKRKMKKN